MRPSLEIEKGLEVLLSVHKASSVFSECEREGGTLGVNQVCDSLGLLEEA